MPACVFSYVGAMSQPSNTRLGIRTVEWLRDNGAAGIVAKVESVYYTLTAPGKGGPTLKALPKVGYGAAARGRTASRIPPRRACRAILHPALPGRGRLARHPPRPRKRTRRCW